MLQKILAVRALTDSEMSNLGRFHCMANRGNLILGYSLLIQCLEKHPKDVDALRSLADVTRSMGRTQESISDLKRLTSCCPAIRRSWNCMRGNVSSSDRGAASTTSHFNADESEKLLERCTQLTEDTVGYFHARLGDLFLARQLYREALEHYRMFIKILNQYRQDPRVEPDLVLLNAAKCCRSIGEESLAMGYALEAARINPQNEEAKDFFYRGWVNSKKKVE